MWLTDSIQGAKSKASRPAQVEQVRLGRRQASMRAAMIAIAC
jgi:hypothetical protein